jgi:hypothetical protein
MIERVGTAILAAKFQLILAENVGVVLRRLNHFGAMLLFALLISAAFAALGQRNGIERLRYAIWSFALFVLIGIGIAWVMYPFSR